MRISKLNIYRRNIEYTHKLPVISAITTPIPLGQCKTILKVSPTLTLEPIIRYYPHSEAGERLSSIASKIESNKVLGKVEAMDLIMIPKMFEKNQDMVLEKVCELLSILRIGDEDFKLELKFQMQCVIHKYAKTLNDIERLEGGIGFQEAITAREFQDQKLIDKGIAQGKFAMTIEFKKEVGLVRLLESVVFLLKNLKKKN